MELPAGKYQKEETQSGYIKIQMLERRGNLYRISRGNTVGF